VKKTKKLIDYYLLFGLLVLLIFGTITVYNSSLVASNNLFGGQFYFLIHQLLWLFFGLVGGVFFYLYPYQKLRLFFKIGLYISLFFLFLTGLGGLSSLPFFRLFLGWLPDNILYQSFCPAINGARRWFIFNPSPLPAIPLLGRLNFQPAEALKFFIVGYLSFTLSQATRNGRNFPSVFLWRFSFLIAVISGLLVLQPDFGSLLLLNSLSFGLAFLAGVPLWYFSLLLPLGTLAGLPLILFSDYRRARLLTFLSGGSQDPLGKGYQISQVLIALGSGGWFGLGFGNSRQKHGYIPEVATDSIFAIIGEELGWVGTVVFLVIYFYVLFRGLAVSRNCQDNVGKLLAGGVVLWIFSQLVLNLGAVTALIPFTGVPLPMISYGGSSLIFIVSGLGLLLNVSKNS